MCAVGVGIYSKMMESSWSVLADPIVVALAPAAAMRGRPLVESVGRNTQSFTAPTAAVAAAPKRRGAFRPFPHTHPALSIDDALQGIQAITVTAVATIGVTGHD
jgi:hypothetical protein